MRSELVERKRNSQTNEERKKTISDINGDKNAKENGANDDSVSRHNLVAAK